MQIRKAYKFKLKTNKEIEGRLVMFSGHCRYIWNQFLSINKYRLDSGILIMRYHEMDYWLKLWKSSDERSFLKEAHSQILQQKLKDLDKAYRDAFDKKQPLKRMPTKRLKNIHNSFRYSQGFELKNRRVFLPKIGWVGFHKSREILGDIKNITISKKSSNWYVSIQVECEIADPIFNKPANDNSIGIDMGVASLVSYSNGRQENSLSSYKQYSKKLTKLQRVLSRKKKFSKNWLKQKKKIQKLHMQIFNMRRDNLHKISHRLSKSHANIYIENLKISNMSKSAKGDIESPGRNVKAKSGLNRSILDQGWYELRRQLEYKGEWYGCNVLAIDPKYTSQKCSYCGNIDKLSRRTQSRYECVNCKVSVNADVNAARNILAAGLAVSVCGENALAISVKQKPVRKRKQV